MARVTTSLGLEAGAGPGRTGALISALQIVSTATYNSVRKVSGSTTGGAPVVTAGDKAPQP